ncbi:MAG TPA: class I SAM-dependent methyltransferase [Acidimicrobiales bacterium]|nr:class I SAM-dependent methyltransferase [Acidimicrobiales bacterium]
MSRLAGRLPALRTKRGRRSLFAQRAKLDNLFQPHVDTVEDRYPELFSALAQWLGGGSETAVLSFGCATGEEVFTLRRYLPDARLRGLDINRWNVAECRRRRRRRGDQRMSFAVAGTAGAELPGSYDAVLAMAVFRHGSLGGGQHPAHCDHLISFEAFERTVGGLVKALRPGGYLLIEHANFRFTDTVYAGDFEVVSSRTRLDLQLKSTPLYGRDNQLLPVATEVDVAFRKRL